MGLPCSSFDQELLDEAWSRRQQLGNPVDAPSERLTATSADPSRGTSPGGSPETAMQFPSATQAAVQTVSTSHVDSAQRRQGGGATSDVVAASVAIQGGLVPQGGQQWRRPGSGHLEAPASVVGRSPPALSSALSQVRIYT